MATLETATRNAACDAIVDLIDGATAPGYLAFEQTDTANTEVARITFGATAFGNAAVGVATASAYTTGTDSDADGGTVGHASIYNGSGTKIMQCTTGTSAAEINLSSLSIGEHDSVTLAASMTITVNAS